MPFGDTAKKVQRMTKLAEKLYERVNQVVEQVQALRERAEQTSEQIEAIDRELAEQRALVEAMAEQQGLDIDEVIAERVESADPEIDPDETESGEATNGDTGDEHAGSEGTSPDADDESGAADTATDE